MSDNDVEEGYLLCGIYLWHALLFVDVHGFVEADFAIDNLRLPEKAPYSLHVALPYAMWLNIEWAVCPSTAFLLRETTASPGRSTERPKGLQTDQQKICMIKHKTERVANHINDVLDASVKDLVLIVGLINWNVPVRCP